jgi:signal transduction histidine kinase
MENENIKILYVEHDQATRKAMANLLELLCSDLYAVKDASEALSIYNEHTPDIVISDIKMPGMNGIQMVKEIKKIDPNQYVIFTTAHNDNEFLMQAIECQVEGYILKPINFDMLKDKVNKIIEQINLKKGYEQQQTYLLRSEKLVAMGEIISNIAHQWRQPLSVISTSASSLQLHSELGTLSHEGLVKSCDSIGRNAQYLSSIIDDFDNFINGGSEIIRFDLLNDTNKFLKLIDTTIKEHNICVVPTLKEDVKVQGHPSELIQCFINIFNNSKEALLNMPEDKRYIFISEETKDDKLIITFKDSAGGIPEDIINKIFEPYFTTKHKSRGVGLGLYVTYQIIVNKFNGTVDVQNIEFEYSNEKLKGALFTIILPISEKPISFIDQ